MSQKISETRSLNGHRGSLASGSVLVHFSSSDVRTGHGRRSTAEHRPLSRSSAGSGRVPFLLRSENRLVFEVLDELVETSGDGSSEGRSEPVATSDLPIRMSDRAVDAKRKLDRLTSSDTR